MFYNLTHKGGHTKHAQEITETGTHTAKIISIKPYKTIYNGETDLSLIFTLIGINKSQGEIKLTLNLSNYLTINNKISNLKQVRLSEDNFKYQIDINTSKRIKNTAEDERIEKLICSMFYHVGYPIGAECSLYDLLNKNIIIKVDNGIVTHTLKP